MRLFDRRRARQARRAIHAPPAAATHCEPLELRRLLTAGPVANADSLYVVSGHARTVSGFSTYLRVDQQGYSREPSTFLTSADSMFSWLYAGDSMVGLRVAAPNGETWELSFRGILNGTEVSPLSAGHYPNAASNWPIGQPMLRVDVPGQALYVGTGEFTIETFVLGAQNVVAEFAATFVQHAPAGTTTGRVAYSNLPGLLQNDTFDDAATVSTAVVAAPQHGTLVPGPDSTYAYTPDDGFAGADTFTYRLVQNGVESAPAAVTLNVGPVNTAPSFVAGADVVVPYNSGAHSIPNWATSILPGSDPAEAAQRLEFVLTSLTTPYGVFAETPSIDPVTGTLSFRFNDGISGLAKFSVALRDDAGRDFGGSDLSVAHVLTITATPPPPTANPDTIVLAEDTPQAISFRPTYVQFPYSQFPWSDGPQYLFNPVNSQIGVTSVAGPAANPSAVRIDLSLDASRATYLKLGTRDGSPLQVGKTYSTDMPSSGLADGTFEFPAYVIPGSHTFVVHELNVAPDGGILDLVAEVDPLPMNTIFIAYHAGASLLANDTFGTFTNGSASLASGPSHGTMIEVRPGHYTYTPHPNYNGTDSFTYRATENGVDGEPTTVTLTILAVNDAPTFTKGADVQVLEDAGAQAIPGWAGAISAGPVDESGQALTFVVTGNSNPSLFATAPVLDPVTGALAFTPATNAYGTATISVLLKDDGGTTNGGADTSVVQTFTIAVKPVNDAPSFSKGPDVTAVRNSPAVSRPAWATNLSAGPGESGQILQFVVNDNSNPALFSSAPVIDADGNLSFTAAAGVTGVATVTVALKDDGGVADGGVDTSASQTFTVTVRLPAAPVTQADEFTYRVGRPFAANVLENDFDPDAVGTTARLVGQAANGVVTLNSDGSFAYAPAPGFSGTDSFTYVAVAQGDVDSAPTTVTITVILPQPPTAVADSFTYRVGRPFSANVLANDIDVEGAGMTARLATPPGHGTATVALDGAVTFTPEPGYSGADTFTYVASAMGVDAQPTTVTLTIVPPPPVTASAVLVQGLPPRLAAGDKAMKAFATVTVMNPSRTPTAGKYSVQLALRPVGGGGADASLAQASATVKLAPGASKVLKLKFAVPATAPEADYQVVATVAGPGITAQHDTSAAAGGTYSVLRPFVRLEAAAPTPRTVRVGQPGVLEFAITNTGSIAAVGPIEAVVLADPPQFDMALPFRRTRANVKIAPGATYVLRIPIGKAGFQDVGNWNFPTSLTPLGTLATQGAERIRHDSVPWTVVV